MAICIIRLILVRLGSQADGLGVLPVCSSSGIVSNRLEFSVCLFARYRAQRLVPVATPYAPRDSISGGSRLLSKLPSSDSKSTSRSSSRTKSGELALPAISLSGSSLS